MFWVWFFLVGIIGNWLAGKTTIPRLRRAAPLKLLKALVCFGIACFTLVGIFARGNLFDSWFFNFLAATLSWAGFISVSEQIKRSSNRNNKDYYRDLESEIAGSKKNVPRVRTPDQAFLSKTNFEFPVVAGNIGNPPGEGLADLLAKSVAKRKTVEAYQQPAPIKNTLLDVEQRQIRGELLGVLLAHVEAGGAGAIEPETEMVDLLAPAPPAPSLFSTPILDAGIPGGKLGVVSRFGSTAAKTLDEPLMAADLISASGEDGKESREGFTYQPKLIESKFSKPID